MPNIEGYKLTNKGNALQIKVEAGKCKLNITKLKLGSGTASGDIVNLTDLVQVEQTVPISKIEVVDDYTCRITGLVTNQGLNKTYYIREIGLYAQDPDDGEILYLVAVDKNPDIMPADNYQMIISQEFNIDVIVSNVDSVNVTSQPVHLVTSDEVDEKIEEHNTAANPHENIFKRVLITEAKTAANTADWNTLTESRTYKISGATFAADKHQPVGAVGTGELVVLKNGDDTIAQVYYANSAAYDKAGAYHRMCIGGTWTDWVYNITNKGGSVTGDFNINGKLTVQNIEVSEGLTIGGAPPLKQDAIDKLQDQIIAPTQNIYVNAISGNDDNDGTSSSKAVRSLNKAYELIKKTVPDVTIFLYNGQDGIIYEAYPLDMIDEGYSTERLNFKVLATSSNTVKPTIRLNFGQVKGRGGYDSTGKYGHPMVSGNIFVQGTSNLYINIEYMKIEANTDYMPVTADYRNYIIKAHACRFLSCIFNFSKYTFFATNGSDATFEMNYCTFANTNDNYLIRYYMDFPEQWEDEIDYSASVTISQKEGTFVTALANGTNIPSAIKELENNGIASSVGVIKKNWS